MPITDILERIYPASQIFVKNPLFFDELLSVVVDCVVPRKAGYTTKPVPYVTAENHVRILSQTSYLLAYHIINKGLVSTGISIEEFLRAMEEYQLYYRNLSLTFHKRVEKGRTFKMELNLKNMRTVHRLQDFILFTFANKRTVISGEMSFVFAV